MRSVEVDWPVWCILHAATESRFWTSTLLSEQSAFLCHSTDCILLHGCGPGLRRSRVSCHLFAHFVFSLFSVLILSLLWAKVGMAGCLDTRAALRGVCSANSWLQRNQLSFTFNSGEVVYVLC